MADNKLKEKNFEEDIERWLLEEGGYEHGYQFTYSKERAIDLTALTDFITATQPKEWARYQKIYGVDHAVDQLYKRFQEEVVESGLLHVLRYGIDDRGVKLRVAYFAPASELNDDLMDKYRKNRLMVTRQFAYSTRNNNTIDMVLSLNGIPIIAIELKNQLTGQSVENSKRQWREDRDPVEPLFQPNRRILAYFGVDLYEVVMATRLDKEKTFFMPFNQGSNGPGRVGGAGNPQAEPGEYVTSYFWKRVLRRDMLLSIIQRYISVQREETLKIIIDRHGREKEVKEQSEKIIFPRYHQLDVVEKLISDTAERGAGHNYLIQHSAGSGKSNSIAWLTYRLASLHDKDQRFIFNSVLVLTDRRVLNRQLQNTVLGFDHTLGQVETVRDDELSTKLARLLNDDNTRIIICTIHRFKQIYEDVTSRSGKRYAIVVDEAHSSQSGKAAQATQAALADTDEALRELAEIEGRTVEELEEEKDKWMDLLTQGRHDNLSFYAFTATPKPKTLQTFGVAKVDKNNPGETAYEPFHIYSMQQAIEEGFIQDVLLNYTPISVAYEIAKNVEENPDYEETPATRAIKAFHDGHQRVIEQKVELIAETFRSVTLQRMDGRAKAMVVCPSRAHALRYYFALKDYCKTKGYTDIRPLVAFSGEVSLGGEAFTEVKVNSSDERRISEDRLPLYFGSQLYNMLIVADKYQTGFDEPLLHTMFVDKRLRNVKAVQTLSRLNRAHKLKKDTFVFDFANTADEIQKAFQPFYTATELVNPVEVNYIYTFRKDMEAYGLWTPADIDQFYDLYQKYKGKDNGLGALSGFFLPILGRVNEKDEETRFEIRSKVKNFVRFYAYMAQIERTFDLALYKTYVFADTLYKLLPKTPHENPDLNKKLLLVNSQIKEGDTVAITLKGVASTPVKGESGKNKGKIDDKRDLLSNIIDKINILYQGNFSEADRVIVESIIDRLTRSKEGRKLAKKANDNAEGQFIEAVFPQVFDDITVALYNEQNEAFRSLFNDREKYDTLMKQIASAAYHYYRENPVTFDRKKMLEAIKEEFACEFEPLKSYLRPLDEVAETMIDLLRKTSISDYDGLNDVLLDALYNLIAVKSPTTVERRKNLITLVTKFETYLKKLYYLINGEPVKDTRSADRDPSLANCIFAFKCLWGLKNNPDSRYQQLYQYLELTKGLRNDEAHLAKVADEKEMRVAAHAVGTIMLYTTARSITDLEMAGVI